MVEADHLPRRDETAVGTRWYPKFGGKGGNQAVAVVRAGGHARMLGAVGDDGFGQFLRARLDAAGVDARLVETLPGVGSGMSVAIMDAAGDYAATIVSGANRKIDPAPFAAEATWDGVAMLVLQNEVPEAVNLAAAQAARARAVPVLLNAAPARPLAPGFAALVDVLVVNAVEAEMMGAQPVTNLDTAAAAASCLGMDYPTVVVTAGGQGLAAVTDRAAPVRIAAEPVTVVSTHGAGDCFVGALAVGLVNGAPVADACRSAAHAAALHVSSVADRDRQP
jgi:ribokinase